MKLSGQQHTHWPTDIVEAKALQERLRKRVLLAPLDREPRTIAGVDAAFIGDTIVAVACCYDYPALAHREDVRIAEAVAVPYVPGFLSFREGPAVIRAIEKLSAPPEMILLDGQGIAHPRGLGIASHIGVLLDIPTIGCAKSRLVGTYTEPALEAGAWSPLFYRGKIVGAVLRTRERVKPVFVSPGHKVDLAGALRIALSCVRKYRIPEPLRRADALSKRLKKDI